MELKRKLADLRKGKGLTQLELAEMLSVSRQAISRWEVGTAVPSLDNLISLSEVYGVPLDYLVHGGAEEPPNKPAVSVGGGQKRAALLPVLALSLCILIAGVVIGVTVSEQTRSGEGVPVTSFRGADVAYAVFLELERMTGSGWMEARQILRDKCPQLFPEGPRPEPVDGRVYVDGPVGYLVPIN